jgi:RNA polymerase sigma factor for flagellar operon FliA
MAARTDLAERQDSDWRAERDRRVIENLALARVIAIRVHENLPVHVDLDDLIHAGVLGLFDAAQKYDPAKNSSFQSYAKHRIKGAILDSLRQLDWASRDLRKRQKRADEAARGLSVKLGRVPTESEVAAELGLPVERWRRMSMELRNMGLALSFNAPVFERDRDLAEQYAAAPDLRPDRMCERAQLRSKLKRAIGTLPERYQKVVFLYYTNEMTMKEIGALLGVNESRVSQIHKIALQKMAVALRSEGIGSPDAL